ncbi:Protein still life, isoforms C/SIF type 2 [Oopsacas minuta]|uniref:Protein still life, isoforms C/SIF type 2 n=1 Tax=Oopsacas minuta TaxID=111878 RepID=A0AAV7JDW3_9METZ|nr:Protein still life, isoforms C/SIF type 2 [Oopsacas minuta]
MIKYLKSQSLWQDSSWEVLLVTLIANLSTFKLGFGLGYSSPTSLEFLQSGLLSLYTFPIFSSIYALGVGIGCVCVVPFLKVFGRKLVLILSTLISTGSYLIIASSSGATQLIIGRVIAGISAGLCFTTVPIYIGEVSHFKVKGFFAGFFGLSLRFGTLSAYIFGLFLSFRWLALITVFIDVLYTPSLMFICYSPTWLISRRLHKRGVSVLVRLGRSEEDAVSEGEEVEKVLTQRAFTGIKERLLSLFQKYHFKALAIGLTYMIFEPMTGTDVIDAYATRILSETNFILSNPKTASLFFPLFAIAANLILLALVDRVGRKVLTIISGAGIILCLFAMSIYVYVTDGILSTDVNTTSDGYLGVLPVVSLAGVRFLHGLGWGSVGFILLGELFPLKEHSNRLSQVQTPAKRKKLKNILELLPSTPSDINFTINNNVATLETVSASRPARKERVYRPASRDSPRSVEIKYPDGEVSVIVITHSSLILDVLLHSCINKNIDPQDYYIQINHSENTTEYSFPSEHEYFRDHTIYSLELCSKAIHIIDLYPVDEVELGFSIEVLEKNIYGKFTRSFIVSDVIRGGQADIFGLCLGDEILSINSTSTHSISLEAVYSLLGQESVRIEFRTKRRRLPYSVEEIELINTLICPAPPASTSRLSTHEIGPLVIPNPKHLSFMSIRELSELEDPDQDYEEGDLLHTLMTDSQELNYSVRLWDIGSPLEEGSLPPHLSRLTQCCNELLFTEKEFISALGLLTERYLKSLQHESFVSQSEITCLCEKTQQILARQNDLFSQLQTALGSQKDDSTATNLILKISNLFIQHSHNFRLFSIFCTSYRNAQELINTDSEEVLAFFGARNPHNKHELRFDSLLALPIQRILRYPLFLRNMRDSVSKGSEEYKSISNAIQIMDRVAGYIDEIQYMSEKFSSLFNGILTDSGLRKVGVHVDIAELKHKFDVTWLNPTEETGKWKKKGDGPEMTLFLLPRLLIVISYDNKFKLKLSKHGIVEYKELDDLVHYKLALLLFYCTFKDFPDSDGVSNMVSIGSQGIEQKVNLIIKCKSRPEKARLIREFKCAIEKVRSLQNS